MLKVKKYLFSLPNLVIKGTRYELRLANNSDLWELAELQMLCYDGLEAWTYDDFKRDWKKEGVHLYIVLADQTGLIVGVASGRMRSPERGVHLSHLLIEPRLQGYGLGEVLAKTFLNASQLLEAKRCTLEVRKSNLKAINLYQKLGFNQVGVKKSYYKNNEDAILMVWKCDKSEL